MSAFVKDSLWTALVVVLALLCAMALSSGKAFGIGGGPFYGKGENLQKLLDLSVEQVEQLQAFRIENREAMRKSKHEMVAARRQFRATLQDSGDETAIREAFQPVASAMENMEVLKAKMHREYKSILTAEQFDKFQALQKIVKRKHERHGRSKVFRTGGPQGQRDGMFWPGETERPEIEQ